jgi:hypothetical protein
MTRDLGRLGSYLALKRIVWSTSLPGNEEEAVELVDRYLERATVAKTVATGTPTA